METENKYFSEEEIELIESVRANIKDLKTKAPIENNYLEAFKSAYAKNAESGKYEDYKEWFKAGYQIHALGMEKSIWESISKDEGRKQLLNIYWNYFKVDDATRGDVISNFNRMALVTSHAMFPDLHKVMIGGSQRVMDRRLINDKDNTNFRLIDYKNAKQHFSSSEYMIDYYEIKKNKDANLVKKNAFDLWFDNPPVNYVSVVYDAELPHGLNYKNENAIYNDFLAPELKNGPGTYDLFFEHIFENICGENEEVFEFVKRWILHLIKYPNSKSGVALALRGKQGTGKTTLFDILSMFFDKRYANTINEAEQLTNRFNANYASSYLLSLEEAVFAGSKKSGVWAKLKDMLTNPTIDVERKGVDKDTIPNHLHVMITTNSDWAAPKEEGDRRYLVLSVGDKRRNDEDFFTELRYQMENGGAKKLKELALADESIERRMEWKIPHTDAGVEDMLNTVSQVKRMLVRLYEEYHEDYNNVSEIFRRTTTGGLFIQPAALYENYKTIGVGIDRGRKEVKKILSDYYKKAVVSKGQGNVYGYVFDNIEEFKNVLIEEAFYGVSPFKEEKWVDGEEEIIVNTVENLFI